jgi:hypothetical protein
MGDTPFTQFQLLPPPYYLKEVLLVTALKIKISYYLNAETLYQGPLILGELVNYQTPQLE